MLTLFLFGHKLVEIRIKNLDLLLERLMFCYKLILLPGQLSFEEVLGITELIEEFGESSQLLLEHEDLVLAFVVGPLEFGDLGGDVVGLLLVESFELAFGLFAGLEVFGLLCKV